MNSTNGGLTHWRTSYRNMTTTASKSFSKTGRFYDALRFLCSATLGLFLLKLLLLLSSQGFAAESSSKRMKNELTNRAKLANISITRKVEEIRSDNFADALQSWTHGPMPFSVINQAAFCTPRDVTDAIIRNASNDLKSYGVIDIGANGGYPISKISLERGIKWLISFEPDSRNFKRLVKLKNKHQNTKFMAVYAAVSNKNGKMKMKFHKKRNDFSCVSCLDERRSEVYAKVINSVTIDNIMYKKMNKKIYTFKNFKTQHKNNYKRNNITGDANDNDADEILLLKSDTQGHEFQVLSGCIKLLTHKKISNIIIEFDPKLLQSKLNAISIIRLLLDSGLQCTHLRFAGVTDIDIHSATNIASFQKAITHQNVEGFLSFVNSTGKYTDLFCTKNRPPSPAVSAKQGDSLLPQNKQPSQQPSDTVSGESGVRSQQAENGDRRLEQEQQQIETSVQREKSDEGGASGEKQSEYKPENGQWQGQEKEKENSGSVK